MRKASKYFIPAVVAIIMLAACGNEGNGPELNGSNVCPDFTASIGSAGARAYNHFWENNDEIGISGCNRSNVRHHTENGDGIFKVKNAGEQIYFQDESEATFTAYYPWAEMTEGAGAIKADTRNQDRKNGFDFLWAQASGKKKAPNVAFQFTHMMAKVVFTIKSGEGMTYEEIKTAKFTIDGCRHSGSFSIADGSTTVDNVSGPWTFTEFAGYNETEKNIEFSLIFFPQVLDKELDFYADLNLADNKSLNIKGAIDFTSANREKDGASAKNEWVAGRQYNLSLTLHKTDVILDKCVINPWNEVTGDDINVD